MPRSATMVPRRVERRRPRRLERKSGLELELRVCTCVKKSNAGKASRSIAKSARAARASAVRATMTVGTSRIFAFGRGLKAAEARALALEVRPARRRRSPPARSIELANLVELNRPAPEARRRVTLERCAVRPREPLVGEGFGFPESRRKRGPPSLSPEESAWRSSWFARSAGVSRRSSPGCRGRWRGFFCRSKLLEDDEHEGFPLLRRGKAFECLLGATGPRVRSTVSEGRRSKLPRVRGPQLGGDRASVGALVDDGAAPSPPDRTAMV